MGGNALAPFGARRYSATEYTKLYYRIVSKLAQIVPSGLVYEIPYYHEKESFGDMDLLVYDLEPEHYDKIKAEANQFNGKEAPFYRNDKVLSIMFEELQVDIIPMPREDLASAAMYYAYNDLGNLMGKIYHKFGLKYGHRGLTYPMRDGDNQYDEILVSKDGTEIFHFLGLSWSKFCEGFNNLEEIFNFVMGSKYFNAEIFQYENLNHTNRVRDRKRTTYHGFLEYIKEHPPKSNYQFKEDKSLYVPGLSLVFPGFEEKYAESLKKLEHRLKVKAHFNGELVREWAGLEDKKLGKMMAELKDVYGEFPKWVLNYTQDQLKEIVVDIAKHFR